MGLHDDWGRDPSVQMMRRVFARMEMIQKDLLISLEISSLDHRLRLSREEGRDLFERVWPIATRKGITASEEDAAVLYAHCLAKALTRNGIKVPSGAVQKHEGIAELLNEKVK
jgi:hypothetical protein